MNNAGNKKRRTLFTGILVLCMILFDQFTKWMAVRYLKEQSAFVLIKGVLEFDYLENRGVAFGMFQGQRWPILILGIALMGGILYIMKKLPEGRNFCILQILLASVLAGGIGNMIDRFLYGYVVDFISFVLINYPIFNVADCYVVCATIGLFIMFLFVLKEEDLAFLSLRSGKE